MVQQIKLLYRSVPSEQMMAGGKQEEVLKRQRQLKLIKKIAEFLEYEGKADKSYEHAEHGKPKLGTLKIFVNSIFPETPYKTIMVSVYDNAKYVIRETINKFHASKIPMEEGKYFLTMLLTPKKAGEKTAKLVKTAQREYCVLDDEFPLLLKYKHSNDSGIATFHMKKKLSEDCLVRGEISEASKQALEEMKYFAMLCEILVDDQEERPSDHPKFVSLNKDIVAIGSNSFNIRESRIFGHEPSKTICLKHHSIHPMHCVVSSLDGLLTVTPSLIEADVRRNNTRVYETTTLLHGDRLSIGCAYHFKVDIPIKSTAQTSPIYWTNLRSMHELIEEDKSESISDDAPIAQKSVAPCLPMAVRFYKSCFRPIISKVLSLCFNNTLAFKLSPAYLLYVVFVAQYDNYTNHELSSDRDSTSNLLKAEYRGFIESCSRIIDETIVCYNQSMEVLMGWLGNLSEFLFFLRSDSLLHSVTCEAQRFLEHSIRIIMNEIIKRMEAELLLLFNLFLTPVLGQNMDISTDLQKVINYDPNTQNSDALRQSKRQFPVAAKAQAVVSNKNQASGVDATPEIIDLMICCNEWLGLLCKYKINLSFTVQIFQRVFSHLTCWLIDKIVIDSAENRSLTEDADLFTVRVNVFGLWAESQGLELIFNKSIEPLRKVLTFVQAPASCLEDYKQNVKQCDVLNEKQIESLMKRMLTERNDVIWNHGWIPQIVGVATTFNNNIYSRMGNDKLEFKDGVKTPCFVSDNGYSSECPVEVTNLLYKVVKNLHISNIEVIKSHDNPSNWSCRFKSNDGCFKFNDTKAEYVFLTIERTQGKPLGMKIYAIKNKQTGNIGIYITYISPGCLADRSEKLKQGDQLISVNDKSLVGIDEIKAAEIIQESGSVLRFEVLKDSAKLHGLEQFLLNREGPACGGSAVRQVSSEDSSSSPSELGNGKESVMEHEILDYRETKTLTMALQQRQNLSVVNSNTFEKTRKTQAGTVQKVNDMDRHVKIVKDEVTNTFNLVSTVNEKRTEEYNRLIELSRKKQTAQETAPDLKQKFENWDAAGSLQTFSNGNETTNGKMDPSRAKFFKKPLSKKAYC